MNDFVAVENNVRREVSSPPWLEANAWNLDGGSSSLIYEIKGRIDDMHLIPTRTPPSQLLASTLERMKWRMRIPDRWFVK